MPAAFMILVIFFSYHVKETLRDAGRAYVAGARPPAVESVEPGLRSGAARAILKFKNGFDSPLNDPAQLIIGDTPAETLTISGEWTQSEDIIIINDGVLLIRNADLSMKADILVLDQGTLRAESSTVVFDQQFIYQRGIIVANAAVFEMNDCRVAANGYPYNFAILDSSTVRIARVHYNDFTTYALFGSPTLDKRHVNLAGEFVVLDAAQCTFVDIDTMLVWCSMMDSSVIDFAFPPPGPVFDWRFDSNTAGVAGVDYSVYCDSVYYPWWGMFSGSGSDVTIRDSQIRTCGIFFEDAAVDTISGLVNGMSYGDHTLPLADRTLRFIDTNVQTISLYPWDRAQISFSSCILGEVLTMDESFAVGQSYYLDGSGGHIGATDQSVNIAALAMLTCDALVGESAALILAACAQLWGHNWAEDQARLFLVQTSTNSLPEAFDSATVGYEFVSGPATGPIDAMVPILGSVWVDAGPNGNADLLGYRVFFERPGDTTRWQIDAEQRNEVREDTLIVWDTSFLTPGNYTIVVQFYDTLGDTLEGFCPIRLEEMTVAEEDLAKVLAFDAFQSGDGLRFRFSLPSAGDADLTLYDIAGRLIGTPCTGKKEPGMWTFDFRPPTSGFYLARLETDLGIVVRKLCYRR